MTPWAGVTCSRLIHFYRLITRVKRTILILVLGGILSVGGYWASYRANTAQHRAVMDSEAPELMWLKTEFKLSDEEFARISRLHEGYLPGCMERCAKIAKINQKLEQLLAATNGITPEIEQAIDDAARMRAECQKTMLKHFDQVSQAMPPEQGRRYFEWVKEKTFLSSGEMPMEH